MRAITLVLMVISNLLMWKLFSHSLSETSSAKSVALSKAFNLLFTVILLNQKKIIYLNIYIHIICVIVLVFSVCLVG